MFDFKSFLYYINIHVSLTSDVQPDTIRSRLCFRTGVKGLFGFEGTIRRRELHVEVLHFWQFPTDISRVSKSKF